VYYYCAPQCCYLPVTYCPTGSYAYADGGTVVPDVGEEGEDD
jgi:hypothetical protein